MNQAAWMNRRLCHQRHLVITVSATHTNYIQGEPKMAENLYMPITSSNTKQFLNFFTDGISRKFVVTLTLKVPTNLICVVTLLCEMSDIALNDQLHDQC